MTKQPSLSLTLASLTVFLAACGTTAQNSDVGQGVALGQKSVPAVIDVQITETGPASDNWRAAVAGVSCKNKLWDPDPTEENALNLMKKQAKERGFNAIHSVTVQQESGRALVMNCWSAIRAKGVAYNLPTPDSQP